MTGLVYVMEWTPGIYKIGCTRRTIEQRWPVNRILQTVKLIIPTDEAYPTTLETQVHERLAYCRIGQAELFKLDAEAFRILESYPKCKRYDWEAKKQ